MALSLTKDKIRLYASGEENKYDDMIVYSANDITIYAGQVLATDVANYAGKVVPFDAAGTFSTPMFAGFAVETITVLAGESKRVKVRKAGRVILTAITGADGIDDFGTTAPVYASNDDTFTLTSTSNLKIGQISNYVSGEGFHVEFETSDLRI